MKIRTSTLQELKSQGKKFACITSYDSLTAGLFDEAGIEVILVGDSASNTVLANDSTIPVTLDEMIIFGKAVARSVNNALVVLDMPFGSYEVSAHQALENSIRALKETGVAAVKIEGAKLAQIEALTEAGVPVMGHLGFTPQTVHALGGYKVQGRGDGAQQLIADALAIQDAGAFALVLEMIPAGLAKEVTDALDIPTIGIGAGVETDAQILVWTDMVGLSQKIPKFAKQYLSLREDISEAARSYAEEVRMGAFPTEQQSFS
jgi:3-methyl-2-oxobutanoate hydroxymethyltransferase